MDEFTFMDIEVGWIRFKGFEEEDMKLGGECVIGERLEWNFWGVDMV